MRWTSAGRVATNVVSLDERTNERTSDAYRKNVVPALIDQSNMHASRRPLTYLRDINNEQQHIHQVNCLRR